MKLNSQIKYKFIAVIVLGILAGLVSYPRVLSFWPSGYDFFSQAQINLGLDLQGGIHLEYKADVSQVDSSKVGEAMQAVQDVIERRVNAFGVAEPVIYTTKNGEENRLVVELAGVKDINQAKEMIKETPFLEFKEETDEVDSGIKQMFDSQNAQTKAKAEEVLARVKKGENFEALAKEFSQDPGSKDNGGVYDFVKKGSFVPEYEAVIFDKGLGDGAVYPQLVETQFGWHIIKRLEVRGEGDNQEFKSAHILFSKLTQESIPELKYKSTGLTGKNLKSASVTFASQGLGEPQISLKFDDEGTKLFSEITKRNLEKTVAIYLDNETISAPTVQSEITNGEAVITGTFSLEEAKKLARRLNEGALPVPVKEIRSYSIEASLAQSSLQKSLKAGIVGLILVAIFMVAYYRVLGLIAVGALLIYTGLMVALFKLSAFTPWQITLTLPGIAGFILSIGMAVDANILIFERTKEEIRRGRTVLGALEEGFKRAWTSIRDGNVSSIITALILVEMGTGFVKGFALTLIIGVLVSMFTAVTISRTLLNFTLGEWVNERLWLIGISKRDEN